MAAPQEKEFTAKDAKGRILHSSFFILFLCVLSDGIYPVGAVRSLTVNAM
jgi:hypothetical protein